MPIEKTDEVKDNNKIYEVKIRILGNEIFAVGLTATNGSNRWVIIGLLTTFSILTIIGAYGEKFIELYKSAVG